MPSHLTRRIFRHLLSNRPLSHNQLVSFAASHRRGKNGRSSLELASQSRRFWGAADPSPRQVKTRKFEPGMSLILQLSGRKSLDVQTPEAPAIFKALSEFIKFKNRTQAQILSPWADYALLAFEHLLEINSGGRSGLPRDVLVAALKVLSRCDEHEDGKAAVKLSSLIFDDVKVLPKLPDDSTYAEDQAMALMCHIRILSFWGEAAKAKLLLSNLWSAHMKTQDPYPFWVPILGGFASEGNDGEIEVTIKQMETLGIPMDSCFDQMLMLELIRIGDLIHLQRFYDQAVQAGATPSNETLRSVLQFCIKRHEYEWGQILVSSLVEREPLTKQDWDTIFQFAAARGKGVDEIQRMINVMITRGLEADDVVRPDIDTINGLVRVANMKNDPYSAERYISMGERMEIQPDATTIALQIDCRLQAGDVDGAQHAYRTLRDLEIQDNEDVPVLNRLIRALCSNSEPDKTSIMSNVDDLAKRNATFEPSTVAALCLLHLRNNELFDVIDLLHTHSFHYSEEQRATIRDVFAAFILDPNNSAAQAWDAYAILHRTITETPRDIRSKLMTEFFRRKEPEMGFHAFSHMRQDVSLKSRPNIDTYTDCFLGLALPHATLSQLELVHNMLKLDAGVEPNTRVLNALMLASIARESNTRALEFWEQILRSTEGPDYNSIVIALQACRGIPYGDAKAKRVMEMLKRLGIKVTKQIYEAFVGAMAAGGLAREAEKLMGEMKQETGQDVDFRTLGTLYNASRGDFLKSEAQIWAEKRYPEQWKELEKLGTTMRGDTKFYHIDEHVSV